MQCELGLVIAGQHLYHVQTLRHAALAHGGPGSEAAVTHKRLPAIEHAVLHTRDKVGLAQQGRDTLHPLHTNLESLHLEKHASSEQVKVHHLIVVSYELYDLSNHLRSGDFDGIHVRF